MFRTNYGKSEPDERLHDFAHKTLEDEGRVRCDEADAGLVARCPRRMLNIIVKIGEIALVEGANTVLLRAAKDHRQLLAAMGMGRNLYAGRNLQQS